MIIHGIFSGTPSDKGLDLTASCKTSDNTNHLNPTWLIEQNWEHLITHHIHVQMRGPVFWTEMTQEYEHNTPSADLVTHSGHF